MTDPAGGFGWRVGTTPWGLKSVAARVERVSGPEPPKLCVLLLPRELEQFILRDQAEDLLTGPGVIAVEPARIPYGAYLIAEHLDKSSIDWVHVRHEEAGAFAAGYEALHTGQLVACAGSWVAKCSASPCANVETDSHSMWPSRRPHLASSRSSAAPAAASRPRST